MGSFAGDTFLRSSLAACEWNYKQKMWTAALCVVIFGAEFCTCIRSLSEGAPPIMKPQGGQNNHGPTMLSGWLPSNTTGSLENSTFTAGSSKRPCNYTRSETAQLELQSRLELQYRCDRSDLLIIASPTKYLPNGWPIYRVQITNTCLYCSLADIHVTCGEWATQLLVSPDIFRRVGDNDCLVFGGNALPAQDMVFFEYSNSFPYPMAAKEVDPVCD